MHEVPDGLKQMGLAEPDLPVDKERVVLARQVFCDGYAGGVRALVGLADYEVVDDEKK